MQCLESNTKHNSLGLMNEPFVMIAQGISIKPAYTLI